jgi:DNA-binding response OmpR family regulator
VADAKLNRILYVEDDADIREIVRMSLEMVGKYQVAACGSCADALSIVDDFDPDLLLLDVMMPDIDGPGTLEHLREHDAAADAPAIFLTASVQAEEMARYAGMGVVDVIIKPFDPMRLPGQIEATWQEYWNPDHE